MLQDDIFARLLTFPNVLVTGHQAFFTEEAMTNIAKTTLSNLADFEAGRDCPNVVMLPHMGSATVEGRAEMGEKVIINIKTFADGHRPPDLVLPGML